MELEQSVALDPTNDVAQQELKKVVDEIETRRLETAGGSPTEKAKAKAKGRRAAPPMLNPASDKPIDVTFPPDTPIKKIYQALCTASRDQRHLRPAAEGRQVHDRPAGT